MLGIVCAANLQWTLLAQRNWQTVGAWAAAAPSPLQAYIDASGTPYESAGHRTTRASDAGTSPRVSESVFGGDMYSASKTSCILATLVLAASAAHAQPAPPEPGAVAPAEPPASGQPPSRNIGLLVRMNVAFGGTELAHVEWSDGEESRLKAGQLLTFAAGALYFPAASWALEGTVGYKFDQVNGSNGSIKFTRIPVDVVGSYVYRGHRLGAGVTAHLAPKFSCEAAGLCSDSVSYSTALGAIAQYAYGFRVGRNGGFDLGARYTRLKYSGSGVEKIDGSGVGFFFGGWL